MNFDEFENKLRGQPRREIPPEWRREILGPLRRRTEGPVSWWRQLLWPHPAAWASLAAAWIAIFALNLAGAPEGASYAASKPSPDKLVAYQERQRLWAELSLDLSRQPRKPLPAMEPSPQLCAVRRGGCMKWVKRILFSVVALATLVALVVAFENWRGKRAWLKFKTEWESKGESFEIASAIPPKVPDHENFAMTPFFAPLFDYEYAPSVTHKNSNAVLRTQAVFLGSKKDLPKLGARHSAKRTDLNEWQDYFAGNTNYPLRDRTQSAAADVFQALSKYDDVISELRTASARPHSHYPVHYHESFSALLPHLSVLRSVSDIVRLRTVAELDHGRTNEALADLQLSLYLAESLKSEPLLISQLVRIALIEAALNTVWETLDRWGDAQLLELEQTLSRIDVLEDYPKSLRGERAFSNDVFARMRRGEHFPGPDELASMARYAHSGLLYQNQLTINRLHQKYVFGSVDVENRKVDARKALELDDLPELKGRHIYRIFAKMLFPALSKAVLRFTSAQTDLDFAVIACALERHRREHGQYPANPEELRPKFIEKIPHDIVSAGPLHYRQAAANGFTLYSVGFDEKDNNGTPPPPKEPRADAMGYDWVWQPAPKRADKSSNR